MGLRSVSSSTFSMADFDGSTSGGLTSVGWSAMVYVGSESGNLADSVVELRCESAVVDALRS
jgi:hypothetical protein